jgi:ferric iron reductase protein FhuF
MNLPLPASFADCHDLTDPNASDAWLPFDAFLTSPGLLTGVERLLERWGPGDTQAAASLWSQGYFSRLLRPVLAYGIVQDRWFDLTPETMGVRLSELSTPSGFYLKETHARTVEENIAAMLADHIEPVIRELSERTGTTQRLHWSNAGYAFQRTLSQLDCAAKMENDCQIERLTAAQTYFDQGSLFWTLTTTTPVDVRRRVCCLRFRLESLDKCRSACPLRS